MKDAQGIGPSRKAQCAVGEAVRTRTHGLKII